MTDDAYYDHLRRVVAAYRASPEAQTDYDPADIDDCAADEADEWYGSEEDGRALRRYERSIGGDL